MMDKPYTCDLDPETATELQMHLFKNVQNVEIIRKNIISGAWNCAIIKPSLIIDPFQVAVAANKAVITSLQKCMVTRTVYAEILFNLSLSKNISQSLTTFGIEEDKELLVCFLVNSESDHSADILPLIEGEPCPISELSNYTQVENINKVYKLNNYKGQNNLLDVIVSRMVTKSFSSH